MATLRYLKTEHVLKKNETKGTKIKKELKRIAKMAYDEAIKYIVTGVVGFILGYIAAKLDLFFWEKSYLPEAFNKVLSIVIEPT